MTDWFYYDETGERIGPVSGHELKSFAQNGTITRETLIENEQGRKSKAEKVSGFTFLDSPSPSSVDEDGLSFQPEKHSKLPFKKETMQKYAHSATMTLSNNAKKSIKHLGESTGVGQMEGFSIKKLFSNAFRRHTETEMENYFTVGTEQTTPPLLSVSSSWPEPWFFMKLLIFSIIGFFSIAKALAYFNNINLVPATIFFGAFGVPVAMIFFFFEVNTPRNVSLYLVLKMFFLGGIFGLIFALQAYEASDSFTFLKSLGASSAGLIEEPAKLAVLVWCLMRNQLKDKNYMLNGLLFGAAVGAGFAAFESAGYGFTVYIQSEPENEISLMKNVLIMRGILSPFGHIIWTGMIGAALWRLKKENFEFLQLFNPKFITIFVIAVLLHMTWNSDFIEEYIPYSEQFYLKYLCIGAVGWLIIFGIIGLGLRQIRKLQKDAQETDAETDEESEANVQTE